MPAVSFGLPRKIRSVFQQSRICRDGYKLYELLRIGQKRHARRSKILRFGILHGMREIVLFFVVAFIVLIGTYTGYLALQIAHPENNECHGQVACLVIIGLTMFVVAKLFALLWEVAATRSCIATALMSASKAEMLGMPLKPWLMF